MNRSGRNLRAIALGVAIAASATGCMVRAHGQAGFRTDAVVVYDAPPAPRDEHVVMRPGFIWIQGRWNWSGGQWVWAGGHYERARAGYTWQTGRWEKRGNQWHWVAGVWVVGSAPADTTGPVVDRSGQTIDHRVPPPGDTVDHRMPPPGDTVDHRTPPPAPSPYPMQPPPPPQVESPGVRAGYVWIGGHYNWNNGSYGWVPGHWERPRARMVWQAGRWELRGGHYVWVEGTWANGPAGSRDHRH